MKVHTDDGEPMAASFSVTRDGLAFLVAYESRGGGRNDDYAWGLCKVLERINSADGVLVSVDVASKRGRWSIYREHEATWPTICPECGAKKLHARNPDDGCRFCDCGWVGLGGLAMEPDELRKALGRRAAAAGRPQGAKGSGNATKRLELRVVFQGEMASTSHVETWLAGEVICGKS